MAHCGVWGRLQGGADYDELHQFTARYAAYPHRQVAAGIRVSSEYAPAGERALLLRSIYRILYNTRVALYFRIYIILLQLGPNILHNFRPDQCSHGEKAGSNYMPGRAPSDQARGAITAFGVDYAKKLP